MTGNSLAMMPWFPGDFMRSTRGWSVTAKGVYRELLDAQWDMGELPADPEELREVIGATPAEWEIGWKKCEAKFPVRRTARRNLRLETHRAKSELIVSSRSEAGRKGGQASVEAKAKQRLSKRSTDVQANVENRSTVAQAKLNHPIQSSPIHSESSPNHTKPSNGEDGGREKPRAARSAATHIPADFALTPERRAIAIAEHLDPERIFAKFVNHWKAASGAHARKRDWDATWRNWCLNETDRNRGNTAIIPHKSPGEAPSWLTAEEREEFELTKGASRAN